MEISLVENDNLVKIQVEDSDKLSKVRIEAIIIGNWPCIEPNPGIFYIPGEFYQSAVERLMVYSTTKSS